MTQGISLYSVVKFFSSTEKSSALAEKGVFTVVVDRRSNKKTIKKAIESIFGVKVVSIRVINTANRTRTFRGVKGVRSGFKKALVNVGKGVKIDFNNIS